jgi:hypothetical protein
MARRFSRLATLFALTILPMPGCASWRARHQADSVSTASDPGAVNPDGGSSSGLLKGLEDASMHDWNFRACGW